MVRFVPAGSSIFRTETVLQIVSFLLSDYEVESVYRSLVDVCSAYNISELPAEVLCYCLLTRTRPTVVSEVYEVLLALATSAFVYVNAVNSWSINVSTAQTDVVAYTLSVSGSSLSISLSHLGREVLRLSIQSLQDTVLAPFLIASFVHRLVKLLKPTHYVRQVATRSPLSFLSSNCCKLLDNLSDDLLATAELTVDRTNRTVTADSIEKIFNIVLLETGEIPPPVM